MKNKKKNLNINSLFKHFKFGVLSLLFAINIAHSQKVVVIGIDHSSSAVTSFDGFTFVAAQALTAGNIIYFTNAFYNNAATTFRRSINPGDDGNRYCAKYIVPAGGIAKGIVIDIHETGTSTNVLNVTCSSGSCGTVSLIALAPNAINFTIANGNGNLLYAYEDGNDDPYDGGITTVHSVLYDGYSENFINTFGGDIPASMNPTVNFPTAVVVDGFSTALPNSTGPGIANYTTVDFKPTLRSGAVSKITLENTGSYDYNPPVTPETFLSLTAFSNLNLVPVNPTVSVNVNTPSVPENGANLIYTFTITSAPASNLTVNFTVSGTALFSTDYTASGSASFNGSTGSVIIPAGQTTASVTIDPINETLLEPTETIVISVVSGSGYDAGNPSVATANIANDDTNTALSLVALIGIAHADNTTNPGHLDGFSFVALNDIPVGTIVYFSKRPYDNTTLAFVSGSFTGTVKWTAGSGVQRGDVYQVSETSADAFTVTCSDGANCGSITNIDVGFTIPTTGTTLYAYADNNDNPSDGLIQIYSVIHTGNIATGTNGGIIPAIANPSAVYPNSVVIDNFPNATPGRTEFKFSPGSTLRQNTVDRTLLTSQVNWLTGQATSTGTAGLSTERFTNIIISNGVANPTVTVATSPGSVLENSGLDITFTFTLSQNAASNMTINFTVSGTAVFNSDYSQTGAASFNTSIGSITIPTGSNTASVTITPTADNTLETLEDVVLTIDTGIGYDAGNPNVGTGVIVNDDYINHNPKAVIIGINSGNEANQPTSRDPDGFSFVANEILAAGTVIYFTDSPFNTNTLVFPAASIEGVIKYTVGASGLAKGQVVYVQETGPSTNIFSVSCSAGSNCGTAVLQTANGSSFPSQGENLYAYSDNNDTPTDGITEIHSLFYTINSAIPAIENPKPIFPNSIVISGFGSASPDRTEYKFAAGERAANVTMSNMEGTANYLIGQPFQTLSLVPFAALNLCPASISTQPGNAVVPLNGNTQFMILATGSNINYQWQVDTGSGFTNIVNGGVYSGATTPTLSLTTVPCTFINYFYRCVVNACAISDAKSLTVNPPVIPVTTNNALHFDGSGDFVRAENCSSNPIINGGSAITVEYWFKGSNIQSAVRTQDVFNNYIVAGWSSPAVHILSNDQGTSGGLSVGAAATDGNWHHVAFTWQQNTTDGFKSYLDGELVAQRNTGNNPLPSINDALYLGAFQGSSEFTNGSLDNVRIWSVVRNQAQLKAGMCNFPSPQAGLLVNYTFDHGTASGNNVGINKMANNANSGNFTGVLNNFTLTGNSSNWVQGVVPNTLATEPVSVIQNVNTNSKFTDTNCNVLGKVEPAGSNPVAGNVTFHSWVESDPSFSLVRRHMELNPSNNAANATANITLYFTQADFNFYNANVGSADPKLPQNPNDVQGLANIRVVKLSGISTPSNGLPGSYDGPPIDISGSIISKTWNGQFWEIKFSTTGFSGFFVSASSAPLPVNLISFQGKNTEKGNELNWKTSNEKNFSHFEIERSIDTKKFEKIGSHTSNESGNYVYLDSSNLKAATSNLFYRLKMIDLDGKFSFSKIISMENKTEKDVVGNFYPNPSSGKSFVEITALEKSNWNITTYDLTGKLLNSETKLLQKGLNKVSIEKLNQGVNFVRFEWGVVTEIRKIMKE